MCIRLPTTPCTRSRLAFACDWFCSGWLCCYSKWDTLLYKMRLKVTLIVIGNAFSFRITAQPLLIKQYCCFSRKFINHLLYSFLPFLLYQLRDGITLWLDWWLLDTQSPGFSRLGPLMCKGQSSWHSLFAMALDWILLQVLYRTSDCVNFPFGNIQDFTNILMSALKQGQYITTVVFSSSLEIPGCCK